MGQILIFRQRESGSVFACIIWSAQLYTFESYGGVRNFKFRSRDPEHAHFRGQFVMHWLVHVTVSVCTKYEISIFGHSKDIKGVPKFR